MKKQVLYTAIILGLCQTLWVSDIHAEDEKDDEVFALDQVTVTVNRVQKTLDELSNKASVVTREDIEKYSMRDIRDLVRYEPGVTVAGLGRFGLSGFNIRGISGDRILTLVDGAPIPDEFSFGPNLSARRNFIDVDSLKAAEIVRGPASSLYGSNAIGGLVTFVTKDPYDFISETDKDYYASAKLSYDSVDSSFDQTVTYAAGNDRWSGMLIATHRDGEEFETFFDDNITGPDRRSANPINNEDLNLLGKIVFKPNDHHTFKLTVEDFDSETDANSLSLVGTSVFGSIRNAITSEDTRDRTRFALEYNGVFENTIFDEVKFNYYNQSSESRQLTFENRLSPSGINQIRFRDSLFQQDNTGFRLNFVKDVHSTIEQQFVYGIDYDKNDSKTLRLGNTTNADTGDQIPEFTIFPTRDFPISEYESYGFFIQDEIAFLDRKLLIIPGIRYDKFELKARSDEFFLNGNPGAPEPTGFEESELSSKLGVIYNFSDRWSVFGQFAEGFKAPSLDAINTGFTNLAGGYTTLPNPDLKPESSETIEIGLRFKGDTHQFEISAYESNYDNFIESLASRGVNPDTGLLEFQARNLDKTEINGVELKGYWSMKNLLSGLHLQYAYAISDGEDTTTDLPLNTIQPESLVIGLGYDAENSRWGTEIILTANDRKTDIDDESIQSLDPSSPPVEPFQTPGFAILDLVGYYNINKKMKINWGIFNLTDKQYWNWNDVGLRTATSSVLPRLTQPGLNSSISFKYIF